MKLLVIGHSVEDHIELNGSVQIKPGGIFYTVNALKNFIEKDDEIYLCTSVENTNEILFDEVYGKLNREYFQSVEKIPRVYLTLHDFKERDERYENITKNLDIKPDDFNLFDGILLNMITGFDLTLFQLKEIRRNYKGLIYLDVHTLSRGLYENYKRDFRVIPNFDEWASCVDIIQVNENEFNTLSSKIDRLEVVKDLLNLGVKFLIITKRSRGARVYCLLKSEVVSMFQKGLQVKENNKIGCGDIFGAIFFYTYIKFNNLNKSLRFANIAGACAVSYMDLSCYKDLKEDVIKRYN